MASTTSFLYFPQALGYVPLSPENFPLNKTKNKKSDISNFRKIRNLCVQFLPPLLYSFLALSVVLTFIYRNRNSSTPDLVSLLKQRGTYYFVLSFKAACHLYCATYIKLDMLYERKKIAKFYANFFALLKDVRCQNNRYFSRFVAEFVIFICTITFWTLEMFYYMRTSIRATPQYAYLVGVPATLGYFHSTFTFLQAFFLIWYLEVLKLIQTRIQVQFELREIKKPCLNFPGINDLQNLREEKPYLDLYFKEEDTKSEMVAQAQDLQSLLLLYNKVRLQGKEFSKLFGCWITLDIGHSVLRIIFSAYFIASIISKRDPSFSQIVQNFLTVLVYSYLLYMVAKRGSQIDEESREVAKDLEYLLEMEKFHIPRVFE